MSERGEGQLKSGGGAPDFAKETGAPREVHEHERAQAPNVLDPAKGGGKDGRDQAKE